MKAPQESPTFRSNARKVFVAVAVVIFSLQLPYSLLTYTDFLQGIRRPEAESAHLISDDASGVLLSTVDLPIQSKNAPARSRPSEQKPNLPQCGHSVLFSSMRHGSTWLMNSIEHCQFSDGLSYGDANKHTELWRHGASWPLSDVTVSEASEYAEINCSLKIFPFAFKKDVRSFIEDIIRRGLPILVLQRDPAAVFESLKVARESGKWNKVRLPDKSRTVEVNATSLQAEKARLARYFTKSFTLLKDLGAPKVDAFMFEDIHELEYIVARNNGCYIHNCNFLQ